MFRPDLDYDPALLEDDEPIGTDAGGGRMTPHIARARLTHQDRPSVLVVFYGSHGYDGHAELDEDAARALRDELNDCLTALHARAMHARAAGASSTGCGAGEC